MINKETVKSKFKKFGGHYIEDIVEYLKEYIEKDPTVTISVGCDSIQRRRKTIYAITIMLYNTDIKNGAHVVFFREHVTKVRDNFDRLQREAEYALEVSEVLNDSLNEFYTRADLTDFERKRYKYHIMRCEGSYSHVVNEFSFINALTLTSAEREIPYKLVDIHVDYNPSEGHIDKKGIAKNKSNMTYKSMVPYLRSMGYRVFAKNWSFAASSAADLLLQN
jgi:predicted RNase H-related nuclease YkuK (DUF458 family)